MCGVLFCEFDAVNIWAATELDDVLLGVLRSSRSEQRRIREGHVWTVLQTRRVDGRAVAVGPAHSVAGDVYSRPQAPPRAITQPPTNPTVNRTLQCGNPKITLPRRLGRYPRAWRKVSPGLWLRKPSVTCGLTAEDRDQLRSFRVWDYLYLYIEVQNRCTNFIYEICVVKWNVNFKSIRNYYIYFLH